MNDCQNGITGRSLPVNLARTCSLADAFIGRRERVGLGPTLAHWVGGPVVLWLVAGCLLPVVAARAVERPNVVLLLADDLGWSGLSCFGSDLYETPHLDGLAERGLRFTQSYAACTVCSPTRASIMTGMYPARLRLTDFIAGQNRPFARMRIPDWTKGLNPDYITLAEALRDAGYATGMAGKWHLDGPATRQHDGPRQHGFDWVAMKPAGTRGYTIPAQAAGSDDPNERYLTDHLTTQALEFIGDHQAEPFFLYFAYHVPHTPIQGRPDLVEKYERKVREGLTHDNPKYAAMVKSLDQSVGRILARLDELQLSDNTIVWFTSDNGGLTQRYGKHDGFTENLPLRRGKGSAYEGGVRVPTIVRWPAVVEAGRVSSTPICSIDYYPTILDLTETKVRQPPVTTVDGVSLAPVLRGESLASRFLYWHYPHYHAGGDGPYSAVRDGQWRLIEFHEDDRLELYDLEQDIGETNNLAGSRPRQVERLHRSLQHWRMSLAAQMPTMNPDYDEQRAQQVGRAPRRAKN